MPHREKNPKPSTVVQLFPEFWHAMTMQGKPEILESSSDGATLSVRRQVEPSLELSALVAGVLRGLLRAEPPHRGEVEVVSCEALGDSETLFRLSF
jgi:hypothetical protein